MEPCTVSRSHTRGESEDHTSETAHRNGSTLALKSRADVTRSPKQGYQWPHEKDFKFFLKTKGKKSKLDILENCSVEFIDQAIKFSYSVDFKAIQENRIIKSVSYKIMFHNFEMHGSLRGAQSFEVG